MYMAECTFTLTWKGKEAQSPSLTKEISNFIFLDCSVFTREECSDMGLTNRKS